MRESDILLLDGNLSGRLVLPKSFSGKVAGVLLCHGYPSCKDEVGGLYARLAQMLATEAGIASLRFDFRGFGCSFGDHALTTFETMLIDAQAAVDCLLEVDAVDVGRLGVLGFSLGAAVAIALSARNPGCFSALGVWSPCGEPVIDMQAWLGADFERILNDGEAAIKLPWRDGDLRIRRAFLESLRDVDLFHLVALSSAAFLAIGGADDLQHAEYIERYAAEARARQKVTALLPGGNHIFNVLGSSQLMASTVLHLTTLFFENTLTSSGSRARLTG